ncbi:DUF475 domain-containing protein [Tsukamurella ocularis]|uniref:DUF475 domain-containing protein n=1 Tax=Tsukamurella ocularis TaxID=1970234 RepID=UPI00216760C2|nr:DUF475 domain-containing protein [Tsukamurella ocularis]MCS3779250.1 hypothetical protein [Tsukamurella ocularis]MCS3787130.1 hypothetical protein [Tsukamurella ocularis]MCS3852521.1 hypothetical protein [Tsukamurella ocularis]
MFRIFGLSFAITIAALVAAFLYGGPEALVLTLILGVLEISLSFDNAVINATVLQRMSRFWVRMFLTVGILIAVVGMRLVFPLAIVWITAGLNPKDALDLALNPPADGAASFPDGRASYETLITAAHPQIAAFGGMFLLMLFLDFIFDPEREITWLTWIEKPLQRIGQLNRLSIIVALAALLATGVWAAHTIEESRTVFLAGLLGLVAYMVVNGLGEFFHVEELEEEAELSRSGPSELAKATGKAGFFLFLYLEVLDASFSFDGVIGAFAITADPIIIALGLGFIGAMFVRSLTVYLVEKGTLSEYVYLEHGAHWAIGALAAILLYSIHTPVPELVTGLIGVVLIAAALVSSVIRNRRRAGLPDGVASPG